MVNNDCKSIFENESSRKDDSLKRFILRLVALSEKNGIIKIDFCVSHPICEKFNCIFVNIGNEQKVAEREKNASYLSDNETKYENFCIDFDSKSIDSLVRLSFWGKTTNNDNVLFDLKTDKFFPVSKSILHSSCYINGLLFFFQDNSLAIKKAIRGEKNRRDRKMYCALWKTKDHIKRKAAIALAAVKLYRKIFMKRPIWIFSDRLSKAGDNAEALYLHIKKKGFKKAKCYFAINDSKDAKRLKKEKFRLIRPMSKKYKFMFLCADKIISSSADEAITNPFMDYSDPYSDLLWTKKFVFLQHGVIKDDMSQWLNKHNRNIHGFVTSSCLERDSILNGNYCYSKEEVWLTGLARFDLLYRNEQRIVSIMPTWRSYLMESLERDTGIWCAKNNFLESEYFKFYNRLINDKKLLGEAKKYDYRICFMPHPNTITKLELFDKNPEVTFFTFEDNYKDIFAQSDLILTDYSSVAFDFAYLHKPVVYTQFDKKEFFSGSHVYKQGYYDYEKLGFGEVVYDYDSTIEILIDYMRNSCKLKDIYRKRINSFFAFDDTKNSERILNKILEM